MISKNIFSKTCLVIIRVSALPQQFKRFSFRSVSTILRAWYETFKYELSMHGKTDEEIRAIVEHEKGLRAWCSQRSYYLAALRMECKRRDLAYIN